MRILSLLLGGTLLAVTATGCFKPPAPTLHEEERGLVYMFPGIGGGAWYLDQAYRAFRDAGIDSAILIDEWESPFYNALGQLQDYPGNRAHAAKVADVIAAYRQRQPTAPINLVGYSAGGGVTVMVVEALPEDVHLRNVVLVQSAVSPTHDLTSVLRHVDGRLFNLYSSYDWLVLGWGTTTFGTVDRQYVASAGKDGFLLPVAVPDEALRAKVVQVGWTAEMLWSGHIGDHISIMTYTWNKDYVAPYLLPEPTSSQPASSEPAADE